MRVFAGTIIVEKHKKPDGTVGTGHLGKTFDLARGMVGYAPGTVRNAQAVVVGVAVSNLTPKRVERAIGRLQWLFGPRRPK